MARMFGGKLTARQYAVLFNMKQDEILDETNDLQENFTAEKTSREQIRVIEEAIESLRRRNVMNGEWPEDQSYQLMQQELDKAQEMYPTPTKFKIEMREKSKMMHNLMNLRNSSQILEREYYFDEGLGESLNDHIEGLKKKFDSITVETRRDRDNLPIVKISLAPKFKYNLDDIVNMDPATAKKI